MATGIHIVGVSGAAIPVGSLVFSSLTGKETLSELFSYTVQLKTPDELNIGYESLAANVPLKPMVGKDICVDVKLETGGIRYLSGLVTAARIIGHEGRSTLYELRMEPWLELATRTSDYKIFQNKSVVDIIDEILSEYPFPMEKKLTASYPVRSYQVQYGETDYNFIQRLMQEFGIYYYFEHSAGSHKLVLVDAIGTHQPSPDSPLVSFYHESVKIDEESVHSISAKESLRTGKWVLDDFDFQNPKARLASSVASPRETGHADYERFEWPGGYFNKGEGESLARTRMEAQRSLGSRIFGNGKIRSLATGYTFTLDNCPTTALNQEYLIIESGFFIQENAQESGQEQSFRYQTAFELQPTSEIFRPQRTIAKPHTRGPQSAIVTGPVGEEIWTDKYGRVKVQFPWDRYGKLDENSSCWVRVSQPWAGKGFGGMQIPRIGQEVIVDFKNGDPDLPIITGRMYNQDTMPAWGLPGSATQSGMFSHTLFGGPTNGNALRFDDKPSNEEVWLHAEKDLNTKVKNNETHTIDVDRTKTIIRHETSFIGTDKEDGNRTETVKGIHNETIKKDRIVTVQEGNRTLTVDKGDSTHTVTTGNSIHTVAQKIAVTSQKNNIEVVATAGSILLEAKTAICFKVGPSIIQINADGTISVWGPTMVDINGTDPTPPAK